MLQRKLYIITLMILLVTGFRKVEAEVEADTLKTAQAVRLNGQIVLDGILEETDWQRAPGITGFRQFEPDEGEPASESTLVKIIYDDEAMYVGVICYDSEPDKIIRQLTRRDRNTNSDKVGFRVDSHHDHNTAYWFEVNASGVMRDMLVYNNNWVDDSWDAVWDVQTFIGDYGWSAEFKIPYSALRFNKKEDYVWGFDISREIPRKNEYSRWQFVPSKETSCVARYGHLAGIEGIEPPGRMEFLPYAVSYGITEPKTLGNSNGRDFYSNSGVDFKYGISSSVTLDATINPDFGQVESDRAVINLSTYETWFPEKRPFFLEGMEIFDMPYFSQFYSRRIGRQPSGQPDDDCFVDWTRMPKNTTILGAAKVTGKTGFGTSFGILNAVTEKEKAEYLYRQITAIDTVLRNNVTEVDTTFQEGTRETTVEPEANYSVLRLKQDIYGSSYIGGMFTSAIQSERDDAFAGSLDWKLYFSKQMFSWSGMAMATQNGEGTTDYVYRTELSKNHGKLIKGYVGIDYFGNNIDCNRLGFLSSYGTRGIDGWIQFYTNKNFSIFRHNSLNVNFHYNEKLDGYRAGNGGNINSWTEFKNGWGFGTGIWYNGDKYDFRETRDGGLWHKQACYGYWFDLNTDYSDNVAFSLAYNWDNERDGLFHGYGISSNFRLVPNFEFSISLHYYINRNLNYWGGYDSMGVPVFARLDNNDVDLSFRGTYTFNRNLSLQWYTQAYISTGEYKHHRLLLNADNYGPEISDDLLAYRRPDFNYKSFNMNLILRWEYMPGSTIFLVWTQARDRFDREFGDFNLGRDFKDIFGTPQTNTFLIKANYWWNL